MNNHTQLGVEASPDPEYHRRRAEVEMEHALRARVPDEALRHLELARFHRQRRELMNSIRAQAAPRPCRIGGTDKEC